MTARGFLPAAETEMREAARFYEERSRGLGHDFLNEVERTIESIVEQPYSGVRISSSTRRRILRRFPFGVLYTVEPDRILCCRGDAPPASARILERSRWRLACCPKGSCHHQKVGLRQQELAKDRCKRSFAVCYLTPVCFAGGEGRVQDRSRRGRRHAVQEPSGP